MIDILFVIIANLIRTFVVFKFLALFEEKKHRKTIIFLIAYTTFFGITGMVHIVFQNAIYNIVCNVLGLFALTLLYEFTFLKRVVISIMIYLLNMSCDGIVYITLVDYKIGDEIPQVFGILTSILVFLIELIVERFFVEKEDFRMPISKCFVLLCIPVISGFIIWEVVTNPLPKFTTITIVVGMLVLNVLLFYLYNSIARHYEERYSLSLLERQIAAYSNQLAVVEIAQEENNSLKHDMKHHMRMIRGYLEKKDLESLNTYLLDIENNYFTKTNEYVNSGNKEIDSILNYMLSIAKKKLKNVTYNVKVPENISYNALAVNTILGNLLENAICASEDSEDKILNIKINVEQGVLYIYIANSYLGELNVSGEKFLTTKKQGKCHGIGLENVKKMIEKNEGALSIKYTINMFEVQVLYYLSENL